MGDITPDTISGEEIICQCFQVADVTIKRCIAEGDLETIEQVTAECGAGGGCQSCHMLVQLFIDQHHKKLVPEDNSSQKKNGTVSKRGFFSKLFAKY